MNRLRRWIATLLGSHRQPVYPSTYWLLGSAWLAQAVYVAAKLDVAERLRRGPMAIGDLAAACGVREVPLLQVLRALAGFGIFAVDGEGRVSLNEEARRLLADDRYSVRPWALVCGEQLWPAAGRMLDQVRGGPTGFESAHGAPVWAHYAAHPEDGDVFDTFMSAATDHHVAAVTAAYPFARHRRVVDVGAGRGSFLRAMLRSAPLLHGVWYDRPEVLPSARGRFAAEGLESRCEFVAGSFLESVPAGADLYTIKHVLHDWSDESVETILRTIVAAMDRESTLLIVEALLDERSAVDGLVKLRDVEQMFWTGGRVRSRREFARLLGPVGLAIEEVLPTPIVDMSVIRVRRRA